MVFYPECHTAHNRFMIIPSPVSNVDISALRIAVQFVERRLERFTSPNKALEAAHNASLTWLAFKLLLF